MGDPAGVGPELCLRLFTADAPAFEADLTIFGSDQVLNDVSLATGIPVGGDLYDFGPVDDLVPGHVSARTGAASHRYLTNAIDATLTGHFDGIVTGPISKEALALAGIAHAGHTEILVERTGADRHAMMLTAPDITCSLVTTHCALAEVAGLLTTDRILEVIELTAETMRQLRGRPPRLTILGLNPHAGEGGLFGNEESAIIQPAVEAARAKGISITDPLPPDTAFLPARRAETDAYVCMYHDQGLIPLKTLAFDSAVNVTLGLPIVRTSVDHGTALDIAWDAVADPSSLYAAVELAAKLARPQHGL
jgi:4-hydroxythreonine-4-phosphate dehydrogenase